MRNCTSGSEAGESVQAELQHREHDQAAAGHQEEPAGEEGGPRPPQPMGQDQRPLQVRKQVLNNRYSVYVILVDNISLMCIYLSSSSEQGQYFLAVSKQIFPVQSYKVTPVSCNTRAVTVIPILCYFHFWLRSQLRF